MLHDSAGISSFLHTILCYTDTFERIHDHKIIYRVQDKDADISNHADKAYLYNNDLDQN